MVIPNHTSEKKTDESTRLCVDFRKLSQVTMIEDYYMPLIEDILNQVKDCKYHSKVNLKKEFYQIPVRPDYKDILVSDPGESSELREYHLSFF